MTLQRDFLDDYQLTTQEFAAAIRVSHKRVQGVLSGRESIDADLALRLARVFGGSAEGWLSWQHSFELWHAHERAAAQLEAITPLDPDTRLSVLEDEPLDPELLEELRRRMAGHDDPRRWVVVSAIGATPFRSQDVAESVAVVLGERKRAIEVTAQDLEAPQQAEEADRKLRERVFKRRVEHFVTGRRTMRCSTRSRISRPARPTRASGSRHRRAP